MIYLILLLALLLRLVNLNQSFWLDEAAQIIESQRPFFQQFDLSADFHPPLFHLLLHFWLRVGDSEIIARLPGVFLGTASVYLVYRLSKAAKLGGAALPAAILLSVSPYHIYYSQELRPYMLFAFLALASVYAWLIKSWKTYSIINIFLLYTNYFASFLMFGQLATAYILKRDTFKLNLKSLILSYLFLLPWLPELLRQMEVGFGGAFAGWQNVVSENALRAVPLTFAKFIIGKASFDNNLVYAGVLLPVFLIFAYAVYLTKSKLGRVLVCLFFTSLIAAFLVSLFLPLVAPQRLIFLLPVFLVIIASVFENLKHNHAMVIFGIALSVFLTGNIMYFTNPRFQREDWRASVAWLESEAKDDHLVVFAFPEPFAPFLWYSKKGLNAKGIAPGFSVRDADLEKLGKEMGSVKEIYYYGYLTDLTDRKNKVDRFLISGGFILVKTRDFPGVGFIYKYEKNNGR